MSGREPLRFLDPTRRKVRYRTLYERLVANTVLSDDGPDPCWLWVGIINDGYPRFTQRVPWVKHPVKKLATRAMLEEFHQIDFPFDEAGHLPQCPHSHCINPLHLEVQTKAHNMAQRWGQMNTGNAHACWIPTLFPRVDELQLTANFILDLPFVPTADPHTIPF